MKKALIVAAIALILIVGLALSSCTTMGNISNDVSSGESTFVIVEEGATYTIIVDKQTKVMYWRWNEYLTPLVKADGTPRLWKGAIN